MAAELKFLINAVDNASATLGKIGKETEKLGGATAKLNAASRLLGAGAIIAFGAASVKAYAEAEASQVKLQEAYRKFPAVADVSIQSMRDLNSAIQAKTGSDDDELAAAEAKLAMYNLTGSQIQKLIPIVNDYAIANGIGVTEAAGKVGKAMLGNAKALKDVGIDFKATGDKAKDFDAIYTALEGKVGGAGEAFGESTAGQLKILQASFSDLQEEVGAQLVPALKTLVDIATPLLGAFGKLPEPMKAGAVLFAALGAAALLAAPRVLALKRALDESAVAGAAVGKSMGLAAKAFAVYGIALAASSLLVKDATLNTDGLAQSLNDMAESGQAAGVAAQFFGEGGAILQENLKWATGQGLGGFDRITYGLGAVEAALGFTATTSQDAKNQLANLDTYLANLAGSNPAAAAAGLDYVRQNADALGLSADDVNRIMSGTISALDKTGGAAGTAADGLSLAASSTNTFEIKAKDADSAAKSLKAALDALGGKALSVDDATSALYSSLDSATQAMADLKGATDKGGTSLNLQTEAGRTAQSALASIAKAADDVATAQAAAGASTDDIRAKQQEARDAFITAARAAGITAAGAAEKLADKYGLIPDKVVTDVIANTVDATNNIDKVIRQVDNLDGRTVTVTVNGVTHNVPNIALHPATGGYISGPGTSTSDSIPAMLSNGEFVVRAAAVSRAGIGLLSDLNDDGVINRARFAVGGFASPAAGLAALQRDTAALVAAQQQLTQLSSSRASTIGGYASMGNAFNFGGSGDAAANLLAAQEAVNMARTPAERVAALAKLDQAKAAARDAAPTAGNLLKGLKAKLGDIKSFYTSLKELRKRGLPLSLLGQVVEAGPLEGGQMAKALLSASPKDFAEIIATQGQIEKFSKASAEYDPLVIRQRGVVNAAVTRARRDATYVSSVRIDLDGKQVAAALLAYKKAMGNRPLGLG